MSDGGMGDLDAHSAPPPLQLDKVKASQLASAAAAAVAHPAVPPPPAAIVTMDKPAAGDKPATKWNTKNLALRLGADAVSAASAAVLVAPIISIIDR